MLNNLSLNTFTTTVSNLWNNAKNYVTAPQLNINQEQVAENSSEEKKTYSRIAFKRLLILSTLGLFSASRNQAGLSLGLATLFVDSVNAAYPTVANPIPTQYAQPGQNFSFVIDLNQVFNDPDGDIMSFAGATMVDDNPLPAWISAEPVLLGYYDTPGLALSVTVQNEVAFVADYDFGLQLINVSNPAASSLLGNYNTPGYAYGVTILNSVAYIGDGVSGLQLINVSNPAAPNLLGYYVTSGYANGVSILNSIAYVTNYGSGLQLIDVSNPAAPSLVGAWGEAAIAYDVTVLNDVAYVADGYSGLQIIDVTNPMLLVLLGSYDTPGFARNVTVMNDIAYVADDVFGLQFLNISNPAAPRLLANYKTPGAAWGIALIKGVAYVADEASGLQILDLRQTRLVGTLPINAIGSYNFLVHATNINGEWIATPLQLMVGTAPIPTTTSSSPSSTTSSTRSTSSNTPSISNPVFLSASQFSIITSSSSPISSPTTQTDTMISFSVSSATPIMIELGISTVLTVDHLAIIGNVRPDQVIYSVQGNSLNIIITVNGIETTQFTQADVEGQLVEIALNGVTCGDYSTDLQLEANVAGSNASPQRVDVGLIFHGTTCANAKRLSAFSFRDVNIGFGRRSERQNEKRSLMNGLNTFQGYNINNNNFVYIRKRGTL